MRLYGVADVQLSKPPLLLDRDLGGLVSSAAFSPDGSSLLVSVGPPANQIVRLAVIANP